MMTQHGHSIFRYLQWLIAFVCAFKPLAYSVQQHLQAHAIGISSCNAIGEHHYVAAGAALS